MTKEEFKDWIWNEIDARAKKMKYWGEENYSYHGPLEDAMELIWEKYGLAITDIEALKNQYTTFTTWANTLLQSTQTK